MDDKVCLGHSGLIKALDAICNKIEEKEAKSNIKFDAIYRSIELAKYELDRRLEGMNEFRAQLSTQSHTFMTRAEIGVLIDKLEVKLNAVESCVEERRGSTKWSDHIITVLIAAAVMLIFKLVMK